MSASKRFKYWSCLTMLIAFFLGTLLADAPSEKPASNSAHRLRLRINNHECNPGDTIILDELLSKKHKLTVGSITHEISWVGVFDRRTAKNVALDGANMYFLSPESFADDFDDNLHSSHGLLPTIDTPTEYGFRLKFQAKRYGVVVITAVWHDVETRETTRSNPVMLTISPKFAADGKPIVDPSAWSALDAQGQLQLESAIDQELRYWRASKINSKNNNRK